jgi:D-arabinose 1-dehydrogenase-like Zn-dependent alcohol dehydrogenase
MPPSVTVPGERRVACALRAGGPDVISVEREELPELKPGEVLIRVAAAGLNHAETLIRSGNYVVRLPFPYAVGGEGAGIVVAPDSETLPAGTRVCWGAVLGSCADYLIAPAWMLAPIPDLLTFENAASLAVAGLTAGGLARVWPLEGRTAVVWAAAGAVGRMLVAILTSGARRSLVLLAVIAFVRCVMPVQRTSSTARARASRRQCTPLLMAREQPLYSTRLEPRHLRRVCKCWGRAVV